ncbi:pre-rRNA-processing protein TSR1 homolog [Sycon ciliatum]|uniref:pre-rRNA-processing protein TSR1 homolog n=1 Tax=Sycon ciliatum TaxID=27933 RepID=UPI0031F61C69
MSSAHKPGSLKQQNKSHKTGKHRSKGAVETSVKGRVSAKSLAKKGNTELSRLQKRNQLKQIRRLKRDALLTERRGRGVCDAPPHAVLVVPLDSRVDGGDVIRRLCSSDPDTVATERRPYVATAVIPRLKRRFSFMHCPPGNLYALLDAGKVADTILFVLHADCCKLSSYAETCLSCLIAQGVPACTFAVQGLDNVPQKRRSKARKAVESLVSQRFPKEKLMNMDTDADAANLLRSVSDRKVHHITFRDQRPALLAEEVNYVPSTDDASSTRGCLQVSGYVRGKTFDANQLVHLVGFGDYQLSHIDLVPDPCTDRQWQRLQRQHLHRSRANSVSSEVSMEMDPGMAEEETTRTIQRADPEQQVPLLAEQAPVSDDELDEEQSWPTEEEIAIAQSERKKKRSLPKGTSDYQAAWIMGGGGGAGEDDDVDDGSDADGAPAAEYPPSSMPMMEGSDDEGGWEDCDGSDDGSDGSEYEEDDGSEDGDEYDTNMDFAEEEDQLKRIQAQRDEEMYPDEVDTPQNIPARIHFGAYRGLESFRSSPWDATEGLPANYRRIFQFQNYAALKKTALKEESSEGALPSWYVTLHLINVPSDISAGIQNDVPLVVFGLLQHEHKMSVLNFSLTKHPSCALSIQSEDNLIFHCGWRRFSASAIFSQHTSGNKHKSERFLPNGTTVVASVYGPISYAPIPTLVFLNDPSSGQHVLVGTGSLLNVNPNRLVIQKAVVSGHPFKINRRVATIRYMFFDREDILFFKAVELWSKHGRRGHIKEPLGTHGHMKCVFNRSLKAQDTVCMSLYKRIFPKWTFDPVVKSPAPVPVTFETSMDADMDDDDI